MPQQEMKIPDGGNSWLVAFAAFCNNTITLGIIYNVGVFLAYFAEHYNASKAEIATVGSLVYGCPLFFGPVSSAFSKKFGFRLTAIVGGIITSVAFCLSSVASTLNTLKCTYIIAGFGTSLIYYPSLTSVIYKFSTKRAFAIGLVTSGPNLGTFIFAPLTNFLLDFYNFYGTMLIYGALVLNCVVFGALLGPLVIQVPQAKIVQPVNEEILPNYPLTSVKPNYFTFLQRLFKGVMTAIDQVFSIHLFKNISFLLLSVGISFGIMCSAISVAYNVHNAILKGINKQNAAFLMSIFGISRVIARCMLGFVISSTKIQALLMHNICFYICGLLMFIITACSSYLGLIIVTAMIAFTSAAMMNTIPIMLVDFVGLSKVNEALGLIGALQGAFTIIAIPVGGYLFDVTGNYNATFYMAGTAGIFYATLVALIPQITKYYQKSEANTEIKTNSPAETII